MTESTLVVVAAPAHPLTGRTGAVEPEALSGHLQLVIDSCDNLLGSREFGFVSDRRWYLAGLDEKRDLLLAGIGWGSMPRQSVVSMLADDRLVKLAVTRWDGSDRMPLWRWLSLVIPIGCLVRRAGG